jgi:hypothetical protein
MNDLLGRTGGAVVDVDDRAAISTSLGAFFQMPPLRRSEWLMTTTATSALTECVCVYVCVCVSVCFEPKKCIRQRYSTPHHTNPEPNNGMRVVVGCIV